MAHGVQLLTAFLTSARMLGHQTICLARSAVLTIPWLDACSARSTWGRMALGRTSLLPKRILPLLNVRPCLYLK